MKAKEISVIVIFKGQVPSNIDIDEVQQQIENRLDDQFRLCFEKGDEGDEGDEDYDEDIHEPLFSQSDIIIAEAGFQIATYNK